MKDLNKNYKHVHVLEQKTLEQQGITQESNEHRFTVVAAITLELLSGLHLDFQELIEAGCKPNKKNICQRQNSANILQ